MSRARAQVTTRSARGAPARAKPAARRRPAVRGDGMMPRIPLPEGLLRRVRNWTLGLFVIGACIAGLIAMGVPQMTGMAAAHTLGRMGFTVRNIQLTGLHQVDRDTVYRIVSEAHGQDMPLVDLAQLRSQLLQIGWIEDARVSRRLPDTLVVDSVERTPSAVWQNNGQLMLIDASGVLLEPVSAEAMPDLPLVIGDGANEQEQAYNRLLATAPALKPQVKAATWVGNRRWDLTFVSGEKLQLPEGEDESAHALVKFAELDGTQRLLGRGYLSFDMRDFPAKMVVRTAPHSEPAPAPTVDKGAIG